jgi:hypothetical protein
LKFRPSYLKTNVYPRDPFENIFTVLPGERIEPHMGKIALDGISADGLERKLYQSCHKLCLMWQAGIKSIAAAEEFDCSTIKDTPSLFGEDAINVNYHLDALVIFARSSLDIASTVFGFLLPDPFKKKHYDSLNSVVKEILKYDEIIEIAPYLAELIENKVSWLSIISNTHKGRGLRDKPAHEMEFPIDYMELNPPSEKRSAIVWIDSNHYLPLQEFVDELRVGTINGFLNLESLCLEQITMGENGAGPR